MVDVKVLASVVFSGLRPLVIESVEDAGEVIMVRAATRGGEMERLGCATPTTRLHAYQERSTADVHLDGRRVLLRARIRRTRCDVADCTRRTFREQVPGLLQRYQRRTIRLTEQIRATVRGLTGRSWPRLLPALGIHVSRDTALRTLLDLPLRVPQVLGIDDFALHRGRTTPPCSSTPTPHGGPTRCPARARRSSRWLFQ